MNTHQLSILAKDRLMVGKRFLNGFLLLLMSLLLSIAHAKQDSEPVWAETLSKEQRFLVFPHIDAGFRSLKNDDSDRAVREFTRANEIAPNRPILVGYLVQALLTDNQLDQAIAVLDVQLSRTPDNRKLQEVKNSLIERLTLNTIAQAKSLTADPIQLRLYLQRHQPVFYSAFAEREWLDLLAQVSTPAQDLIAAHSIKFAENNSYRLIQMITMLAREDDRHGADNIIKTLPASFLMRFTEVDNLSYQLLSEGFAHEALLLLIEAYPYESYLVSERETALKRMLIAQAMVQNKTIFKKFVKDSAKQIATATQEKEWLMLVSTAFDNELSPLFNYQVQFLDNRARYEQNILDGLEQGAPLPNALDLHNFMARIGDVTPEFTATLSFRLFEAGANAQAWSVLMARYPFSAMTSDQRDVLLERLSLIVDLDPTVVTQHDITRLSQPLNSVRARLIQANLLASVEDCSGVRRVLGDFSAGYGADQWLLLGSCYQKSGLSGLAQAAYQQAVVVAPSALTERAVAYAAFSNEDYGMALKAWRRAFGFAEPRPLDLIAAATTALAAKEPALARGWLDQYHVLMTKPTADYWTLRAQAWANLDLQVATADMKRAIALEPTADRWLQLGRWQLTQGDKTVALASIQQAVYLEPKNGLAQSELGFILYQLGQIKSAREHLSSALISRPGDPQIIKQLAYTDQQLGDNAQSMAYIRLAVDHDLRFLPQEQTPEQVESLFALRRMHEDLDRRWTFSADALTGSAPSLSALSPQPGQDYESYSQIEIDYRLGDPAVNNGKTLSVYSRVFGGGGVDNDPMPIYGPMLGVGLRWKPLPEQVLYLSIEKQIPLDHGTSAPANTMLRASASLFNAGVYSDDWHPTGDGWTSQNLYLDAAYYLSDQAFSLLADYRIGYHHKIKQGQTIEPYARVVVSKVSGIGEADIRAGVGMRWNLWGVESRYSAYAGRGYLGVEIQGVIQAQRSDRVVALISMGVRW